MRGLRIGAVAAAVLTFVFLEQPTGMAILVIAALLLVVLAVIEFLGRPVNVPPADAGDVATAGATAAQTSALGAVPPAPREGENEDVAPAR